MFEVAPGIQIFLQIEESECQESEGQTLTWLRWPSRDQHPRGGTQDVASQGMCPAQLEPTPTSPSGLGRAPARYLFKCSSRKRKVMRLGSGRERSRCIMQFSLAAGSDRAAGTRGVGVGLGSGWGGLGQHPGVRRLREPGGKAWAARGQEGRPSRDGAGIVPRVGY